MNGRKVKEIGHFAHKILIFLLDSIQNHSNGKIKNMKKNNNKNDDDDVIKTMISISFILIDFERLKSS